MIGNIICNIGLYSWFEEKSMEENKVMLGLISQMFVIFFSPKYANNGTYT